MTKHPESTLNTTSHNKAPLLDEIKKSDLSEVAITLGAGVDPDGLASQMAMKIIIKHLNPDANVSEFYRGDWDRPQNRTMRELMGLDPKPYSDASNKDFTCIICVDGPPSVCFDEPHFVIDHHKQTGKGGQSDVRFVGACSSIMWEYCMAAGIDWSTEEGAKLATALLIGIFTDTSEMEATTSDLDFEAAAFCGTNRDSKLFSGIKNYPKPRYYKDLECQAWGNATIEGTALVTGLGVLPKERKGVVSTLAEEFVGYGAVSTTVVIAMVNGDMAFSVRSNTVNVDEFIKNVFQYGGGKTGAGAGTVPMPELLKDDVPESVREDLFQSLYKTIAHKTLKYLGDGARSVSE